jgi:Flp pilus assembly protein TadG
VTGTGRRSTLLVIVRSCSARRPRRDENGASLVEFAIILPVFALMLFGLIQFGLAFTGWDQLRNGVQASARDVALDGSLCSSMTVSQCETAIENTIGTPVGTTGPPTVALYYNSDPSNGPLVAFVCASAQVQSFTGYIGDLTLSSTSEFTIQQTPNSNLQNTAINCPAPLSTLQVPQSAGCNVNAQGGFGPGALCLSYNWLDGYYIWDPPPATLTGTATLTSTAASWMQIVPPPSGSTAPPSGEISDADAFQDGISLNSPAVGPWTCTQSEGNVCTQITTNASGIPNFLDPNATPADSALRAVG